MRWLLDNVGRDDVMVGTLESWIIARLTGEAVTEAGNASRTMLLSLQTGDWDDGLLEAFGVSRDVLPEVRHSNADFGRISAEGQSLAGVPIVAVLADSHASLFAHHSGAVGVAKATLGTGTSVMAALAELGTPSEGVDTTLAWWLDQPTYALEGNILATGQAIDWVAGLLEPASTRPGGVVVAEAAASVDGSHGVMLVPAFTGLGAPHWDRGAVALLSGMTAATSAGHVARAALESVAHQVADVVESMVAVGAIDLHELRVDGGGSSSDLLLQSQADVLGVPVVRVREPELSAMGVARLASIRLGHDPGSIDGDTAVAPGWPADRRERERNAWQREVDRARMRIEER
jgi:glycerol kinase